MLEAVRGACRAGARSLLVAHRPALVALADRVLALEPAASRGVSTIRRRRAQASGASRAPLARTLDFARPAAGRLGLATLLGAGAIGAAIGLIATSAWLISRASQRPQESALAVAIVAVQFFALSRGLSALRRTARRATTRRSACSRACRVSVYGGSRRWHPLGLPAFRSGDLLARLVHDVDSLQDLLLRVVPPFAIAAIVGRGHRHLGLVDAARARA